MLLLLSGIEYNAVEKVSATLQISSSEPIQASLALHEKVNAQLANL